MGDRRVSKRRGVRRGVLLAFLAVVTVLTTGGFIASAPVASAADPTVPVPTLTNVSMIAGGLSFAYTAGPRPPGLVYAAFQYDVSKDGGTTWASSTTVNNPLGSRDYWGST